MPKALTPNIVLFLVTIITTDGAEITTIYGLSGANRRERLSPINSQLQGQLTHSCCSPTAYYLMNQRTFDGRHTPYATAVNTCPFNLRPNTGSKG